MPSRVSPAEQILASIDALFADPDRDLATVLEEVAQLSVRLVISGWVRGLSTRDIQAALRETLGADATCRIRRCRRSESRSARSNSGICPAELAYLYVDGSHFRYHHATDAEPVLVAYGSTMDGGPVLLDIDGASRESTDACVGFLRSLTGRGLAPPLLVTSDGGPGLIAALDAVFGRAWRQRCLVHRARNVLAKVPKADADEVKADFWAIFDDVDADPGGAAVAQARRHVEVGWSSAGACWTTVSIRRTPPTGLQPGDLVQDFGRVRRPRFTPPIHNIWV